MRSARARGAERAAASALLGCLSFHPRKIVTTGEGGAVTTASDEVADAVRRMRHHGIEPRGDFEIAAPGPNYRLSRHPLRGRASRSCAGSTSCSRRAHGSPPPTPSGSQGVVATPSADEGDVHGWQAYVVQLERRDEALRALREQGIEAQIGTYALHRLAAYRDQGAFPGADAAYERALALPFHTRLTDAELDRVADALRPFS